MASWGPTLYLGIWEGAPILFPGEEATGLLLGGILSAPKLQEAQRNTADRLDRRLLQEKTDIPEQQKDRLSDQSCGGNGETTWACKAASG